MISNLNPKSPSVSYGWSNKSLSGKMKSLELQNNNKNEILDFKSAETNVIKNWELDIWFN